MQECIVPLRGQRGIYLARISRNAFQLLGTDREVIFSDLKVNVRAFFKDESVQLIHGTDFYQFAGMYVGWLREYFRAAYKAQFWYGCRYCMVSSVLAIDRVFLRVFQNEIVVLELPIAHLEFAHVSDMLVLKSAHSRHELMFDGVEQADEMFAVLRYYCESGSASQGPARGFQVQATATYEFSDVSVRSISLGEERSEQSLDMERRSSGLSSANNSTTSVRNDLHALQEQKSAEIQIQQPYDAVDAEKRAQILELGLPCCLGRREVILRLEVDDAVYIWHKFGIFGKPRRYQLRFIIPGAVLNGRQAFSLTLEDRGIDTLSMAADRFAAFCEDFQYLETAFQAGWQRGALDIEDAEIKAVPSQFSHKLAQQVVDETLSSSSEQQQEQEQEQERKPTQQTEQQAEQPTQVEAAPLTPPPPADEQQANEERWEADEEGERASEQ